jgi:hypothetical protein
LSGRDIYTNGRETHRARASIAFHRINLSGSEWEGVAYQFGGGWGFGQPNVQDRAGETQEAGEEGVKT